MDGMKKTTLLESSYSPNLYACAISKYHGIINYCDVEDMSVVMAKINEWMKDATRSHILDLVGSSGA